MTFAHGTDYRWTIANRDTLWWHLPFAADYAREAELLRLYSFALTTRAGETRGFTIPAGYRWNGASAGHLWGRDDPRVMRASLIHDWLYDTRPAGITRRDADRAFFRALKEDGAPRAFRIGAHLFARLGPFAWAWNNGIT